MSKPDIAVLLALCAALASALGVHWRPFPWPPLIVLPACPSGPMVQRERECDEHRGSGRSVHVQYERRKWDLAASSPRLRYRCQRDCAAELSSSSAVVHLPRGGVVPRYLRRPRCRVRSRRAGCVGLTGSSTADGPAANFRYISRLWHPGRESPAVSGHVVRKGRA